MSVQGTSGVAGGGASASYVVDSEKVTSGCWCFKKKKQPVAQPAPIRRLSSSPNHNRTESAIYAGFKATQGGYQESQRQMTDAEVVAAYIANQRQSQMTEERRQQEMRSRPQRTPSAAASAALPPARPPLPDMVKIEALKSSGHHQGVLAQHPLPATVSQKLATASQKDAGDDFDPKAEESSVVRAEGVGMRFDPTSTVRSS